jgi:hypothetical protein
MNIHSVIQVHEHYKTQQKTENTNENTENTEENKMNIRVAVKKFSEWWYSTLMVGHMATLT